jgi:fumarate hydratase class II
MDTRTENDALGDVEVPKNSYAGSFYTRAKGNFQISEVRAPKTYRVALAWVKMAAAKVNAGLGDLDQKWADAICEAGEEFIDGKFDADFDLDAYQAGAGTPYNMNLNEILANRGNEILGGEKGKYDPLNPNDHVNMSQSSNDVTPTATRIAALLDAQALFEAGDKLVKGLEAKAKEFSGARKVGRTHLQDAVPVTLGQEFGAYASSVKRALKRIKSASEELMELGIGGSATGSAINVHPEFAEKMCKELSGLSGFKFFPTENKFETTHSMAAFLSLSSALRGLAVELMRISNDLRLMNSGPYGGLKEIDLPEVQPGSSIMPGKVNPSIPECLSMICVQVMGLDHAIDISCQQGQFELNWYTPLIMFDLLHQIEILTSGMVMFDELCVKGIEADTDGMKKTLSKTTACATALAPHMGYKAVAELVHESVEKGVPFEDLVPEEYRKYLVC